MIVNDSFLSEGIRKERIKFWIDKHALLVTIASFIALKVLTDLGMP